MRNHRFFAILSIKLKVLLVIQAPEGLLKSILFLRKIVSSLLFKCSSGHEMITLPLQHKYYDYQLSKAGAKFVEKF